MTCACSGSCWLLEMLSAAAAPYTSEGVQHWPWGQIPFACYVPFTCFLFTAYLPVCFVNFPFIFLFIWFLFTCYLPLIYLSFAFYLPFICLLFAFYSIVCLLFAFSVFSTLPLQQLLFTFWSAFILHLFKNRLLNLPKEKSIPRIRKIVHIGPLFRFHLRFEKAAEPRGWGPQSLGFLVWGL